jgi:hypothetical protein
MEALIMLKKLKDLFMKKFICNLIPDKLMRKKIRAIINKGDTITASSGNLCYSVEIVNGLLSFKHKYYGKSYYPIYDPYNKISSLTPNIYNQNGKKIYLFFLRDSITAYSPYALSDYFQWDRYNFGLNTHFYTHECMLETMGAPQKKYGILWESESILPNDYKMFDKHEGLEKDFDLIFTYSADLLNKLPNARFVPFAAQPWYDKSQLSMADDSKQGHMQNISASNPLHPENIMNKTKNISFLSSKKLLCDLHRFRFDLAHRCKREKLADTFGTFDGGRYVADEEPLRDYRFTIIIENMISPYYFSERLTRCFLFRTIPIYLGATKISQFFNPDGIIAFNMDDDIEKVLHQCSKEEYEARIEAISDNFNRVKEYFNTMDYMYEKYLKDGLDKQ